MKIHQLFGKKVKRDGEGAVSVQDIDVTVLLREILQELQMLNMMVREMTDLEIEARDI